MVRIIMVRIISVTSPNAPNHITTDDRSAESQPTIQTHSNPPNSKNYIILTYFLLTTNSSQTKNLLLLFHIIQTYKPIVFSSALFIRFVGFYTLSHNSLTLRLLSNPKRLSAESVSALQTSNYRSDLWE